MGFILFEAKDTGSLVTSLDLNGWTSGLIAFEPETLSSSVQALCHSACYKFEVYTVTCVANKKHS